MYLIANPLLQAFNEHLRAYLIGEIISLVKVIVIFHPVVPDRENVCVLKSLCTQTVCCTIPSCNVTKGTTGNHIYIYQVGYITAIQCDAVL